MFILQNLKDYIDNPMGKGSTAITNKQLIRTDLNTRYEKLMKDKKITFTAYKDKDEYYFHFIIPSESKRMNTYDVVLYFTMDEEDFKFDNFLNRYYLKFFSNCPSFTFTYAYVYNNYDMMIKFLRGKFSSIVLDDNPVVRNPGEVINYEKSIYFACYYLMNHRTLMNKMYLNSVAKPFAQNTFVKTIRETDKIQLEIKKENNRLSEEKKNENKSEEKNKIKDAVKKAVVGVTDKLKVSGKKKTSAVNHIKPRKKISSKKSTRSKT